jgi:MFS family permease
MDRLPGWPLPRFDLFVLGLAYFFVFYDITDIGFGLPAIVKQFSLSSNDVKFVAIAIGLVGYIVGSNLIGGLADWRGRRLAFPYLAARLRPGVPGHRVRDGDRLAVALALPDRYGASARLSTWRRHMWGSSLLPQSGAVSR